MATGVPDNEIAVVAFKGATVQEIARALREAKVAFHDAGLQKLSSTDAFKLLSGALNGIDLEAIPDEATALEVVDRLGAELGDLLGDAESEQRDDWERLRAALDDHLQRGSSDLLSAINRIRAEDEGPSSRAGVTVTTMHKAKGLEWEAVAITDLGARDFGNAGDDAERCRLLYVALTRAKRLLHVSWTGQPSTWLA